MIHEKRVILGKLLFALLIGLAGMIGTLLLLSQGASARLMVEREHTLAISQSQRTNHIQASVQEVYTLSYQNVSTNTIAGVIITNTLDPHVTYITASPRPTGGLPDAPYWSIGSLSASVHGEIVLTITVADPLPDGTVLTNIAAIDGHDTLAESCEITTTFVIPTATTGAEPLPSDDVDAPSPTPTLPPPNEEVQSGTLSDDTTGPTVTNLLAPAAATLTLTKSSDPDLVPSGAPLTYILSYANIGDTDATSVTITDVLDSRVTYISASPEPTDWTTPTLYWDLGSLISTSSGEIVISTTVQGGLSEGTTLTNTATIDSQGSAPFSVTETTSVLAHGAPVSVTLTPPAATITAGQSITYALTAHDAFDNDWTATNSATYNITPGASGAWATNVYTAEKDGTWIVTGTYESRSGTATLTVTNVAPTAVISGPAMGEEGELLTFDASLSGDPGNDITSYGWDFVHSGTFVTDTRDISATHVYTDDGVYTLALQVTDDNIASDVGTATITIANVAPIVNAGLDQTVDEAAVASFSGSFTDPGADNHTIEWNFGDGASTTGTLTPTHVYTEPGNFNVTLTITDNDEGIGSDDLTVTVQNLPPIDVDAGGPYAGTAGAPATLAASGLDPGGGPVTYTWDLNNDGQYDNADGPVAPFTRTVSGPYIVAVQVADSQSAVATDTAQVTISPAELDHIVLSPSTSEIPAGETQPYTVEAFDEYDNSRGDVTTESDFIIVESGDGGTWVDNAYVSANYGDWTVQATYTGMTDTADLRVLSPDLHIEKSANLESVEAGAYLTYTLTYSNTGNQTADGFVITDTLDPNVDYYSASPPPSGYDSGNPYWSLPSLNPGDSNQIRLSVQVHRPLPNQTILTNTAWIDSLQTAPLSTTHQTTVTSRPVLTMTKVDSTDPVTEGQGLGYTIVITNSGNENATGATVVEYYDPNISIISTNPPADSGSDNQRWTFDILPVDIPTEIYISSQVTAPLPVGTVLTNMVTLNTDQTGPLTATEATSVTSVSDLTVFKLDQPNKVEAGEVLQYIITYWNSGEVLARDVVITETYDSQVEFVSWESPFPITGTNNVWYIGDLLPDEGGNIVVYVRVDTPLPNNTVLTNRVTIDSLGTLPKSYTETTTVSSAPELAFSITDNPDPVEAGDPLTYTLRYTNTGNADATGVVITATFDSNVTFVDSDPLEPTPGGDDQVQVWDVGTIPGEGGTGQIVIHTDVTLPLTNGTKLDFTVQLEDAQGDLLERSARTTVRSAPILSLDKSNGVSNVEAGDRLTYTLTYANSGNENAYHVIITDTLPNYVEYVGCEGCEDPGPDPEAVVFHISAITQTSGQVRLFVQVEDPLTAGAEALVNIAKMTHRRLQDPIVVSDVDEIDTRPDLTIAASHTPSLFSPGRLMTYTVTYGNAVGAHMDAEGVNIKTTLPNGTEYVGDGWNSSDGQTYVFQIGELLAGSVGHTITFTVRHTDTLEISQPEFLTPFTIAQNGDVAEDANPDNNIAYVYIGVPDLIVADFTVEPVGSLPPDVPVTFTVVLKNQGTGWAWNPDNHGGFFIDVFGHKIDSYPFKEYSDIYTETVPIAPGAEYTITLTHDGFSEQEIREEIEAFYVKVDNWADTSVRPWKRLWGLVPEYNEWNNVSKPVSLGIEHIYLPLVVKQVGS